MPRNRRRTARTLAVVLLGCLLTAGAILHSPTAARAADTLAFTAGMIISDEVFYAPGAMSAAEVQAVLDERGRNCVASGTGVPCLKDFRQTTASRAASAQCAAYAGASGETAAQIIWKVAQACGVNPQVIIVILQKEQGLVTLSGSLLTAERYNAAMGFRCPTGGTCDPAYAGFFNQVYSAAARFQYYADYPTSFTFVAGRTTTIPYHPSAACGGSSVLIRNQATAGLYNYTPYQPNATALAAGYGVGDTCSSYGNRNFWNYFRDWFGPTEGEAYNPFGQFEALTVEPGALRIGGWAIDPDTTSPIFAWITVDGVGRHVYADVDRADIGGAFPAFGSRHGLGAVIATGAGIHRVCVTAANVDIGRHTSLGCRDAVVPGGSPFGSLESVSGGADAVSVSGWAIDPDTRDPAYLWVTVDGVGTHVYGGSERPDVGAAFPQYGSAHGFGASIAAAPGVRTVCVVAANTGSGTHQALGCRSVVVGAGSPVGNIEEASATTGAIRIAGWALDPDTVDPIYVWVTVDGVGQHVRADGDRPDVGAAYPGRGSSHGFAATITAAPGTHSVCLTASNVGAGVHSFLGCRSVAVS